MYKHIILPIAILLYFNQLSTSQTNEDSTKYQLNLNEVVIQSVKETTEPLLQLPAAATFLNSKTVEQREINSLKDATAIVPNLFMPDYGSKLTSPIYIRGVGSKINSPSIGLYVDDVPYFEKAAFDFELTDIERIEVLRGPQGTLYGRNTMGGIINVYTKDATNQPNAKLMLSAGNYGLKRTRATINTPITKKSALSIGAFYSQRDGYFTNHYDSSKVDEETSFGGHLKYKVKFNQHFQLTVMSAAERMEQGGYPYAPYTDSTRYTAPINYNHESGYDRDLWSNAVTLTYQTEKTLIRWVTSHQYLKDYQDIDQDFSPANTFVVTQDMKQNVLAQEIIVKHRFNPHFNWVAGLWGFKQWSDSQLDLATNGNATYTKTYDSPTAGAAAYSELTMSDIPQGLSVTVGLRYDTEESGLDYLHTKPGTDSPVVVSQFDHSLNFHQLLPKLAVSYLITPQTNIYGIIAKGYKSGGFNTSFEQPQDETFDPEYSWNYELGLKSDVVKNKLQAGLALFYIDWRDQQVTQPVYPSKKGTMLKNAGESYSQGFEVEINAHPIKNLNLGLSYGATLAKYETYYRDTVNVDPTKDVDYNGNYFPLVPNHTFMASASYFVPFQAKYFKGMDVNLNYQDIGKIYWNEDNKSWQDSYTLLNGKLAFIMPHIRLELWGKNLLETEYNSFYFQMSGKSFVQQGKPRTFGMNLIFNI